MTEPAPAPDLDLRLIRYFVAVAEHLHFGRAAARLHLTQPSLSRQIHRLEHQLGARLLDRTPQGNTLTAAGEVFLPRARALLRSADQTVAVTRAAAEPSRIVVGYTRGLIVTPAVRTLRRRHPDADVQTAFVEYGQAPAALLEHRVDAVVTRLPLPTGGLRVTVLREEPRMLMMPVDHPLAGKESLTLDDIAGEPLLRVADPEWNAYWRIEPRPDGSPVPDGPLAESFEDKFEIVASGQAVAIVPAARDGGVPRPDLTAVLLRDVPPSHVVLATRAGDRSRLVAAFSKAAEACLADPGDPPAGGPLP
ncbi:MULTISPECIES: LysR family transcriptional regulator [unclassified Streptomyces]|uniref:LysR family transcriptional regulator n=1 Tax=unclassified Streptomyces TaxID=2593676 RepID=UPI0004BEABB1|nr:MULTISPECIES: LysR substrate-binding domain-containing protein [unclassified Streptomyces]